MERLYYLEDYSDECLPCDASLDAWAAWLAKPDPDWNRSEPAKDDAQFRASVTRFEQDIVATRGPDGWSFSRNPAGIDFLAVRFGEDLGWAPPNIIEGPDMEQALRDWFAENGKFCEDREFIAVGYDEPDVVVTYHAGPPPRLSVTPLQ